MKVELNCCHLTQGAVIVVHVSSVEFLHASDVIHPTGKRGAFGSAVQVCHLESQMFLLEYSYVRTFAIASNLLKVNILINDKAELHHPTMVIASKDTSTMVGCNLACNRINGDIEAEDCTLQRAPRSYTRTLGGFASGAEHFEPGSDAGRSGGFATCSERIRNDEHCT